MHLQSNRAAGICLATFLCAAFGCSNTESGSQDMAGMQWVKVTVNQIPLRNARDQQAQMRALQITPRPGTPAEYRDLTAGETTFQYSQGFLLDTKGEVQIDISAQIDGCALASAAGRVTLPAQKELRLDLAVRPDPDSCLVECGPGSFCWEGAEVQPRGGNFYAAHVASATEAWAVGDRGLAFHFSGSDPAGGDLSKPERWRFDPRVEDLAAGYDLTGVWGAQSAVWIVGHEPLASSDEGIILYGDSRGWLVKKGKDVPRLAGVWGVDGEVWAVGSKVCVLSQDGAEITARCEGPLRDTRVDLASIHGNRKDNLWAAGVCHVLHKKGTAPWTIALNQCPTQFRSVRVVSDNDVRVIGGGQAAYVFRDDNTSSKPTGLSEVHHSGMWGAGSDTWFLAWQREQLVHWPPGHALRVAGSVLARSVSDDFWTWALAGLARQGEQPLLLAAGASGTLAIGSPGAPFTVVHGGGTLIQHLRGAGGQVWLTNGNQARRGSGSPAGTLTEEEAPGWIYNLWPSTSGKYVYASSVSRQIFRRPVAPGGKWEVAYEGVAQEKRLFTRVTGAQHLGRTHVIAISPDNAEYVYFNEDGGAAPRSFTLAGTPHCAGAEGGSAWIVAGVMGRLGVYQVSIDAPVLSKDTLQRDLGADPGFVTRCNIVIVRGDVHVFQSHDGAIQRTVAGRWQQDVVSGPVVSFLDAWHRPAPHDDLWAVGHHGQVRCKPVGEEKWRPVESGTRATLYTVWGDPQGMIWLGGVGGTLLRQRRDRLACPAAN